METGKLRADFIPLHSLSFSYHFQLSVLKQAFRWRLFPFALPVILVLVFVNGTFAQMQINGPRPWIDVTALGADPLGVADSTRAINNAITACNGGTVLFPPGTYTHNNAITVNQSCTLYAQPGTATLTKTYNSSTGLPGNSGSFLITASNVTVYGLIYDGGNATTACTGGTACLGICFNASTNGATPISNITIDHVTIQNCDNDSLVFSSASSYATAGPTNYKVVDSTITCSNTADAFGAIHIQGTVTKGIISRNFLDCSQTTSNAGPATIEAQSQGSTQGTKISDLQISDNVMKCAGNGSAGWCIQAGGFNALTMTGLVITGNLFNVVNSSGNLSGCVSVSATLATVISGNECNSNGTTQNYAGFELVFDSGTQFTGNTVNWENPGQSVAINCNSCNTSHIAGNTIRGFGEAGGGTTLAAGIGFESTHASQSISTLTESTNTVTVTTTGALNFAQPGTTVCITGATTAGYNICGLVLDGSFTGRANKVFTIFNPTSGLASCSGSCTTSALLENSSSNNDVGPNTITMACNGTLSSNRYGILARVTGANEQLNNNHIHNNTIVGCGNGASGDFGIRVTNAGTSTVSDSGNKIDDNTLINLADGVFLDTSTSGTNFYVKNNQFVNVTTQFSTTAAANGFIATDHAVVFGDLVSCSASLLGQEAEITNMTASPTWGSTCVGTGSTGVRCRCAATGSWTVIGN